MRDKAELEAAPIQGLEIMRIHNPNSTTTDLEGEKQTGYTRIGHHDFIYSAKLAVARSAALLLEAGAEKDVKGRKFNRIEIRSSKAGFHWRGSEGFRLQVVF